jgi:hypothetical protein
MPEPSGNSDIGWYSGELVIGSRQIRQRVLDALEQRVKQFKTREELWPLRVPHDPVPLDDVIGASIGAPSSAFDPLTLRSRTLLQFDWEDGSRWAAWVIVLPSKVKLYCDSGADETRLLASGGRNEGDESDRLFLELLAESAGQHFGIEMSGGPPARVRSCIADRTFLVNLFVNLFEVTGMEESVREALQARGRRPRISGEQGHDFRSDVERWLEMSLA